MTRPHAEARLDEAWRAYQVFYHADQDRLLRHLVLPLVVELGRSRAVDRFFFTRYELGGPHLRLRWRLTEQGAATWAEATLARRAAEFLSRWPSTQPAPPERIRRTNEALLRVDPLAAPEDDQVFPDNSWRALPPSFEVERYGGAEVLRASLDLFTLSSAQVLRLLRAQADGASAWVRTAFLRLALLLAWGLAGESEDEFRSLAGYAPRLWPDHFAPSLAQGDGVFARRRAELVEVVRRELARAGEDGVNGAGALVDGGHLLSRALTGRARDARWSIAASHLHMTANRLGLANAEEVYLSRLLWRAVEALHHEAPETWEGLCRARAEAAARPPRRSLEELAGDALGGLGS